MKLTDSKGLLTAEAMDKLATCSSETTCECPSYLVTLLQSVRDFKEYQLHCIQAKPTDVFIHEWLASSSTTLDSFLSGTILQLANLEGMIDPKTGEIRATKRPSVGKLKKAKKKKKRV